MSAFHRKDRKLDHSFKLSHMDLLDRDQELAALDGLLADACAGRGGALILRGEPGVGLTALVEYAAASPGELRFASARGVEAESTLRFAALHQLCVSLLGDVDELPRPRRQALRSLFGLADGRLPDPFMAGVAVHGLFLQASARVPLVCLIDDAQRLDPASVEVLAFVARRLGTHRVALVVAAHDPPGPPVPFAGLPEIHVRGIARDAAIRLLAGAVPGQLDLSVRDRLLAEAGGSPLALIELPRQLRADHLSGSARLPDVLPLGERLRQTLLGVVRDLPSATQTLLLFAAVEHEAPATLFWSAAALLGIGPDAARPAEVAGVLRVGTTIALCPQLLGAAIYEAATVSERQRVHESLVMVIDAEADPDRRARHRAAAALTADEDVAAELDEAATRAKARGDDLAATALSEQAAVLSPDPRDRYRRNLAAVQAALAAGALGRATALLAVAPPNARDQVQRAQADRLRSAIGSALGRGSDRATTLLRAARAFESLDTGLARETYLEAIEAAILSGRLTSGAGLREVAEAARTAPAAREPDASAADLLLEGIALLTTSGHKAAIPTLRRAVGSLRAGEESRWLPLGSLAALEIWDDEGAYDLTVRLNERRQAGVAGLGLDRLEGMDDVLAGRFATAAAPFAETRESWRDGGSITARPAGAAELIAAAWRGRAAEAQELAEAWMREAFTRDLGGSVALARYAIALLDIGLGRYDAALAAAKEAWAQGTLYVATAALPEVVEAAARMGEREIAASATARLSERTLPSRTDWALGMLARSRALLEEGARAESLYQDAIDHLRRTRAAPHLARAHLVYGEWLRRQRRRREAREQLRTARDMFIFMGAQAFGERARAELTATGEHARPRDIDAAELLTPQEARIARLVGDGASNVEVGAQLFISAKTVEYHLHKVFRKLGVGSRTQVARALLEAAAVPSGRPAQD